MKAKIIALLLILVSFASESRAQHLICCGFLVNVNGNWIGADRRCEEYLSTEATQEQRFLVCHQFEDYQSSICSEVSYCQPCDGTEPTKNNPSDKQSLGPGAPPFEGLLDGLKKYGIRDLSPEHIAVQDKRKSGGLIRYQIRLNSNGCIMPNGACILYAGNNGLIPEGKQEGAKTMLIGSIQFAGKAVKVAARIVDVETGVIKDAATAKSSKSGRRKAIADAMEKALNKLDIECSGARGLNF